MMRQLIVLALSRVKSLHVTEADDGPGPLAGIEAFGRFQDGIADRCEEPPQVAEVQQVGSYRLFGA